MPDENAVAEDEAEAKPKAKSKAKSKEAELTIAEKAAVALGEEKAAKYAEEQANRAEDDPLVLAQEAYTEAEENREPVVPEAEEEDDGA